MGSLAAIAWSSATETRSTTPSRGIKGDWSLASAQRYQMDPRVDAIIQLASCESDTAPLVAFVTTGGAGVESVRFTGGTLVTPYGAHSAAHAAGTCPMSVVVVTEAHGPEAALGCAATGVRGTAVVVWMGADEPHDVRAMTDMATATPARTRRLRTNNCPLLVRPDAPRYTEQGRTRRTVHCRGRRRPSVQSGDSAGSGNRGEVTTTAAWPDGRDRPLPALKRAVDQTRQHLSRDGDRRQREADRVRIRSGHEWGRGGTAAHPGHRQPGERGWPHLPALAHPARRPAPGGRGTPDLAHDRTGRRNGGDAPGPRRRLPACRLLWR